jgi:hypothetical protein
MLQAADLFTAAAMTVAGCLALYAVALRSRHLSTREQVPVFSPQLFKRVVQE